ncbi:MAG TPA: polymer-forming cytoskeletal protein [Candidatus Dormibacteraeota bacterium]|nr:polymer-forming cytoskeletal protein [Candidatus Dormibacteraeota bacterium]
MSSRRPASRVETAVPAETSTENGSSNGQRNSVVLGPNDRLVGQLYIEGDLRVSGSVEGAVEATGDIEIAGAGKVSGTVTAYNRLVVGSDASLIGGDVRVARLTVADGATFSGHVSMGGHAATVPADAEPPTATPSEAAAETPDEFGTPRASTGWSKRKKK